MHLDMYVCVHMDVCVQAVYAGVCPHPHVEAREGCADGLLFLPHVSGVRDL